MKFIPVIILITLQSLILMFPFWFFWNEVIMKMVTWANVITPFQAFWFLLGLNVFTFFHVVPMITQQDIDEATDDKD